MGSLIKKFKNSNFIGTQLSRFKMGMGYYSVLMSTISAIMLIKTAYPVIEIEWILLLSPIPIIGTIILGYFMDKKNINTMDNIKSLEMTHRFLNTADLKSQEFQLLQTQVLLTAIQAVKNGKDIDFDSLNQKYAEYLKKWKSPYS